MYVQKVGDQGVNRTNSDELRKTKCTKFPKIIAAKTLTLENKMVRITGNY